jgi:hypothetical protein
LADQLIIIDLYAEDKGDLEYTLMEYAERNVYEVLESIETDSENGR